MRSAVLALLSALILCACDVGAVGSHSRTFTSTVTVSRETSVTIQSQIPLEITGEPLRTSVLAEVDITVTASSSTVARTRAEALEIQVERPDDGRVILSLGPLAGSTLAGTLRVRMPARLAVDARANTGTALVTRMQAAVQAAASGGVAVTECNGDITALVTRGNVIVDTGLGLGATINAQTGAGNVELRLPVSLSATVEADVQSQGQVLIEHPSLPPAVGINRTRYRTKVNGGLSLVRALTRAGVIVIRLQTGM